MFKYNPFVFRGCFRERTFLPEVGVFNVGFPSLRASWTQHSFCLLLSFATRIKDNGTCEKWQSCHWEADVNLCTTLEKAVLILFILILFWVISSKWSAERATPSPFVLLLNYSYGHKPSLSFRQTRCGESWRRWVCLKVSSFWSTDRVVPPVCLSRAALW